MQKRLGLVDDVGFSSLFSDKVRKISIKVGSGRMGETGVSKAGIIFDSRDGPFRVKHKMHSFNLFPVKPAFSL